MEIGEKYNRLTAIENTGKQDKQGLYIWKFQCDCGNIIEKQATYVKRGKVKSCGCLKQEILKKRNEQNGKIPIGTQFGKLTVIEDLGIKEVANGRRIRFSKCQCECGNIVEVRNNNLKTGSSQSCGCISSRGERIIAQILRENNINFSTQYIFKDLIGINGGYLKFDFAIFKDNQLYELIEFDGRQHFEGPDTNTWGNAYSFEDIQKNDQLKNEYCKNNNILLVRIPYTEIGNIDLKMLKL